MTSRVGRRLAIVTGLVFFLAGFAAVAYASNSWGGYHWKISTTDSETSPLQLGDNLTTSHWKVSLKGTVTTSGAAYDWNQSVLKNEVVPGAGITDCGPMAGRVEICNGDYGGTGWLGIAQIWISRGRSKHIVQGTVKVNDTYFDDPNLAYNTQPWRDLVMCQEVGHTLGLSHQDESFTNENRGTCMDYTNSPDGGSIDGVNYGPSNLQPNQHDYTTMNDVYAHLNSDGGGSGPGPGKGRGKKPKAGIGADIDLNNPTAWGQAIRVDAQGRGSLYERHLANGETLFTFVTWVD